MPKVRKVKQLTSKTCSACGQTLSIDNFRTIGTSNKGVTYYQSKCTPCTSNKNKRHKQSNNEALRRKLPIDDIQQLLTAGNSVRKTAMLCNISSYYVNLARRKGLVH